LNAKLNINIQFFAVRFITISALHRKNTKKNQKSAIKEEIKSINQMAGKKNMFPKAIKSPVSISCGSA
jgi:hypothetical protein